MAHLLPKRSLLNCYLNYHEGGRDREGDLLFTSAAVTRNPERSLASHEEAGKSPASHEFAALPTTLPHPWQSTQNAVRGSRLHKVRRFARDVRSLAAECVASLDDASHYDHGLELALSEQRRPSALHPTTLPDRPQPQLQHIRKQIDPNTCRGALRTLESVRYEVLRDLQNSA
jgi:hypothetical protein